MRKFHYEAIDNQGQLLEGEIQAKSRSAAIEDLLARGHTPIDAREIGATRLTSLLPRRSKPRLNLLRFTRDLKNLLTAGVPLEAAIEMQLELLDEQVAINVLQQLLEDLRSGDPLSEAMAKQLEVFGPFYISLIRAGEAGGSLETILTDLEEYLEQRHQLRSSVVSALVYPAILIAVTMVSLVILMVFVVPKFTQLFEDMGAELPLPSKIVFAIGEGLQAYGWVLILLLVAGVFLFRHFSGQPAFRAYMDRLMMRLPLVGDLVQKMQITIFARALGTLLSNAVPLLSALAIVKDTFTRKPYRDAMNVVIEEVEQGNGLSQPIARSEYFPRLVSHLLKVGEESGKLDFTLFELARIYDEEVRTAVKRVLLIIEPVMIIGLGIVIGGVIMSILMTLLSVNDFAL